MEAKYSIHQVYKENQESKYEIFNKWCYDNGVRIPKLEYPAIFEGGLLGARASADIQHREAFLFIPMRMLLSLDFIYRHKVLGPIVKENPKMFDNRAHEDWEQLTLTLAMMYEYQLGKDSFWFPYLNLLPDDIEFFCNWPHEDLIATDDEYLY